MTSLKDLTLLMPQDRPFMIFQEGNLFDHLEVVRDNMSFWFKPIPYFKPQRMAGC